MIAPSVPARPVQPRANENKLGTDGNIVGSRINDRLAYLSSFMKKISFWLVFISSKASLAFTRLRKAFTKAPILHYFDPKHHILIETDASSYTIGGVLSQLTTKKGLAGQITHKTNNLNLLSEIGQ